MASASSQCPVCAPIVSWPEKCVELKWDTANYLKHYPQDTTLGTFDQSFKNGCQVCGIIHSAVSRFFKDHRSHADITAQTVVEFHYLPCRTSTIELVVNSEFLELFAEEGESTLPFAFGQLRPMITDYFSPELDRFTQEALGTCFRGHQRCGILESVPLPKRLINVGDADQSPFLYTSFEGESGQYICLSHCWGSPSYTLKTMKGNLEAYTRKIPLADMPRTFSEAVILTRRIGFQYLWIDSLCIVQDDKDDWKSESETMAQTYTNSSITIVAAEAADSREGLLPRYPAEGGKTCYIDWPLPDENTCRICVRETSITSNRWYAYLDFQRPGLMASEPAVLFSRAWTMQELLLPSRLLMFTDRGLAWYCNESFQPATDPIPFNLQLHLKGGYRILLFEESPKYGIGQPVKQLSGPNSISSGIGETSVDGWVHLVRMYTSRHLTFRQDRLRALAGLAKKFQEQSKLEYVAGLWDDKASLPYLIAWDAVPVESGREKPCGDPTECTRFWNPPSWSWASVEGEVSWIWDISDFHADVEITDVSCQWQDANRFSTSLGGEITMRARVLKLPRSSVFYCPQGNSSGAEARRTSDGKVVTPGDYCYQIPLNEIYPQHQLSQVSGLSEEVFMFTLPGSSCDVHGLDWIKQCPRHSAEIRLVLLGNMGLVLSVLILAQHPATGKFIRIDSGKRLLRHIEDQFSFDESDDWRLLIEFNSELSGRFSLPMEIVLI